MMTASDINERLKQIQDEGQGCWSLDVIPHDAMSELLRRALAGDARSALVLDLVVQALREWRARSRQDGAECLMCTARFWRREPPHCVAVLTAMSDDPSGGVVFGLCGDCVARHGDVDGVKRGVLDQIRDDFVPDLREIQPHEAGRA